MPKRKASNQIVDIDALDEEEGGLQSALSAIAEFVKIEGGPEAATKGKGKRKATKKKVKAAGSGTGYGNAMTATQRKKHDAQVKRAEADEMTKDGRVKLLLTRLSQTLVDGDGEEVTSDDAADVVNLVNKYLRNDSLVDVGRRKELYGAVFTLLQQLSRDVFTSVKFFKDGTTVNLLSALGAQAKVFKTINAKNLDCLGGGHGEEVGEGIDVLGEDADKIRAETDDVVNALAVALHIESTLAAMNEAVDHARKVGLLIGNEEVKRKKALPPQFKAIELVSMIESKFTSHRFWPARTTIVGSKQKRLLRISNELSTLTTSLPPGIFVRVDTERVDVMKALIIGPKGTPYAEGCFIFDIVLPPNYPVEPPKVLITTTNQNRCRFNPNLYADGKVCLSLLGTWSGEPWNPASSTLLQVLISIHSLIMIDDPFYNEPGYKVGMHPKESKQYNAQVRAATLSYAIKGALSSPDPVFRDAITHHFSTSADLIKAQIQSWIRRAEEGREPSKAKTAIAGYINLVAGGGIISKMEEVKKVGQDCVRLLDDLLASAGAGGGGGGIEVIDINPKPSTTKTTTTTKTTKTTKTNRDIICLDDDDDDDECTVYEPTTKSGEKGSSSEDAIEL